VASFGLTGFENVTEPVGALPGSRSRWLTELEIWTVRQFSVVTNDLVSRSHRSEWLKRAFDVSAAGLGFALLTPVLLIIAIAVRIDSSGPVFYRGLRTGRFGKPFLIYKFRTMVANAESLGGTSTGKADPRITRLGRLLRRYKVDELPQLLNVIRGDMSIVGPRPEVEEYTRLYDKHEEVILTVRPGITDYASVRFRNLDEVLGTEDVDRVYAERIRPIKNELRIKYVLDRSFLTDMAIIARTVLSIVCR
jgi:lipopolysaccharide/colanic/teichoic acid biosynthesis glycosyltransferase